MQVRLAGPVAEMIYSDDPYHPAMIAEWAADWEGALAASSQLFSKPRDQVVFLEKLTQSLYRQLASDVLWPAIAALADNLLAHETLDCERIEEILHQWLDLRLVRQWSL